jgi:hypothetical protein
MKSLSQTILSSLAGLALASTVSAQVLVSDSFSSSFSNFTVQSGSSADGFSYSLNAGVGGSAGRINAVTASQNHGDSVYYSGTGAAIIRSFDQEYAVSIFFLPGTVSTSNVAQVTTGLLRSTGSNFGGGGSGVWGQFRQSNGGDSFLRLYNQNVQVGSNSAGFTLSNTLWYELETRVDLSSATNATTLGTYLYSRGADGTGARTLVSSVSATSVTIGNNGFNAATFYGAFAGGNNSGSNIAAFDNFSVSAISAIPEPSSFAALAGLGALGLVATRRRRS